MNLKTLLPFIICLITLLTVPCVDINAKTTPVDVLIIGGGASGVTAGIQSARMGVPTIIVEETPWIGGMLTAAGVSAVDGNYNLPGGLWGEFKNALSDYYGGADNLKTGWVSHVLFEPSVGEKILTKLTIKENKLKVLRNTKVEKVIKDSKGWVIFIKGPDGSVDKLKARVIIDATELGDIAKMCGAKYDIGMESRNDTHEDIAPLTKNNIIQDLTYCAILKDYGKDVTMPMPNGYDPKEFACACINDNCFTPKEPDRMWSKDMLITYGKLPNNKYMINWPIEGNDYYVNLIEMTPQEREKALIPAKEFTKKFVYFIQKELGYNTLGLADDEFTTADRLPYIPYHRESRRIHGLVRFDLNHVTKPYSQVDALYRTCVAVGDYPVDHHHTRYLGNDTLPNLYFHQIPSFGLPLGTLIPKDIDGLIVAEKSISVSNIMNGTTRLQPVVLQIGQVAGILASLSVLNKTKIKDIKVRDVQNVLLESKGYLLPYLDVPVDSPMFKPLQRIGSTGILKGVGRNVEWSNQTWLRADTLLLAGELTGLTDVYPTFKYAAKHSNAPVNVKELIDIIKEIAQLEGLKIDALPTSQKIWKEYNLGTFDLHQNIKRGEAAILIDQLLNPFNKKEINIKGKYKN